MKDAIAVTIKARRYRIVGTIESRSRGREYRLTRPAGDETVLRVCHAPSWQVARAIAHGETITYHYAE